MVESLVPPPEEPFERSGGDLCLDFANTWGDRGRPSTERMTSYADLLTFAQAAECVDPAQAQVLGDRAASDPIQAAAALRRALDLREVLYRLFSAQARGAPVAPGDLDAFNARLGPALAHLRLELRGTKFQWSWAEAPGHLDAPLWPILRAAAELLASPRRTRVRECDGAQCTWLFLDLSRAGSRRWCSMASCGNRAKARRHYRRKSA